MTAGTSPVTGIGWRPEIGGFIAALTHLGFVEVGSPIDCAETSDSLINMMRRAVPVVAHGNRVPLGGAESIKEARIRQFVASGPKMVAGAAVEPSWSCRAVDQALGSEPRPTAPHPIARDRTESDGE